MKRKITTENLKDVISPYLKNVQEAIDFNVQSVVGNIKNNKIKYNKENDCYMTANYTRVEEYIIGTSKKDVHFILTEPVLRDIVEGFSNSFQKEVMCRVIAGEFPEETISKSQYHKLKQENEKLKKQIEELKLFKNSVLELAAK